MKHFEFTLDLFWDPSQGGSNYFSIYLQIFFFVLVVICSMIRSNKLLPGRLQLILRYGLFVSAIYHVCPLQQFWSGSDLGPTFFAFALYSLLCFLFNRPECGTRKSLTRISHDISVKFMQSDSQLNWVLSFAIRELLVPEHLAAMLSFFLLRSLASFLPFFKDFEAGSVLSFSTLYYSFITFIFPLCCCFAWWARLFDETARIFLFLCTSMMLGAFQIAYYVAAEVNVSTITALKYLVIYLPWPCLTIGFVLMYLPITFSQPDGGNLAMALRLPFSPNHVPSDRHMGPLATATLQFVMYVLANLWSTSAAKKLAEQAVSTFEIGYLSVSPLDHSGYILLIVAFVMGLGIVSKSLTAAAMLSSTRKLEFRGCAAVTDGVHSKVRPTIDNFKSLFERLHKLVNEVITLETEGKLSKFGGIHHVLTKFPLEHAIQFISQFDHTLELSQQLYPRVPLEDYPSVVGLPKMRLVLQYLGQRSETTQAPTANSQNFFSRAEDRGRRLVADSKLLPVLSKVAGVLNGGDNATYESFDVLDVAVDFKPIKLGEQGPSIFKASAADPSEDAASASRPHADQKALKTVIHMSLGSDISRLIGRLTDRFQEKWSSLLTGSLSDFLDPVRLRVMVEIEAKSGKFFVGLPFLSSHLASGGVGVPTPADLEKHVTNFLKTVTDASSTLQKLSEHSETGALLTTFLRRLNDLSDLLGRLHASHHVGFVELLKLLSRFASLAFAVHEKIGSETVTRPQARAGGEEKKEENKEQGNRSAQLHDYQEETLLHHRYIRGLMVELFEDCVALFSTIFLQEINKISEESLHGILYGQEAISTFLLPFSILFWKVYFNEIVGQIEASEEAASRENHASRELRVFWANVHSRSALDIPFPKKPSKSPEQGWATVHNTADVKENDSTLFSEVVAFLGKGVHFAVQGTAGILIFTPLVWLHHSLTVLSAATGVIRAASQKALASVEARRRAAREAAAARTPAPPSETKTEEATPAEAAPSEAKTEDINLAEAKTEEPASVDAQAPATEARAGEATPAEAHAASTEAKTEEATSDEAQAPPTEAKAEDGKAQTPPTEAKIEEPTPAQAPPTEAKAEEAPSDEVQAAPTEAVKTEEATPPQAAPTEAKAEETTAAEAQAGPTVTEAEDTTADETQAAPTEAKAEDTTADETQANTTEAKAEETTVAEAQAAPTEAKAEEATLDEAQAPTTEATIEDSTSGDAQAAPTEAKAQEATLDEAQEPATEAKAEETTAAEARAASTEATAEETTPSEAQAAPTEAKTEETTLAQTQAPTTEATIEDSTSGDAQAAPTEAKAQEATLDEAQEPATEAKAEETTAAEARAASTEATAEETTPSEAQAAPTEAKTEETTLAQTQAPTTEAKTEDSTSGDAQAAPSEVKAEEATSDEAQAPATEAKAEEATSDEAQAPATEAKAEEATSDEAQAPATEATIEDSTSGDAHAPPTEAQAEEATSDEAQPATEAKAEETTLAQTQAAPTEAKTEDSTSGDAQAAPSEVKAEEATSDEAQAPATEATIEDSTSGDVHAPPTEAQAKAEEATSDEAQAPANEATAEETTPSEAQAAPTEAKAEETTAAETQAPTTEAKTEDSTSAEAQAAPAKAKAEEATLDEAQPATEAKAEETTLAQTQAPTTEATIEDSTSGDAQAAPSEAKAEEATSGEAQAPATEAKAEETTAAEIDQTPSDSKEAAIAHVDTAGTGDGSKVEEEPAPSDSPQNRATDAPDAESSSKNGFSDIVERVSRMLHICGTPEGRSLSRLLSKIGQKQSSLEADLLMIVTVLTNGGDAQRSTAEEEKPMTPLLFTAHQALEFASIRNLVANSKILQTLTSNFPEP